MIKLILLFKARQRNGHKEELMSGIIAYRL
jgi:hypothetical protein